MSDFLFVRQTIFCLSRQLQVDVGTGAGDFPSFREKPDITKGKEIIKKNYNVIFNGKNFYDQSIDSDINNTKK